MMQYNAMMLIFFKAKNQHLLIEQRGISMHVKSKGKMAFYTFGVLPAQILVYSSFKKC